MANLRNRIADLLINKLDLAFTLGRVFGLLPVLIMSRQITDTDVLAENVSHYQVAMFLATLVLYGAPQVYLVKQGLERRVFVFHMLISTLLFIAGLMIASVSGVAHGVILPFLFLVVFRSYYLLYASYLKTDKGRASFYLIGIAVCTLIIFALTMNYALSGTLGFAFMLLLTVRLGYAKLVYAVIAARQYFTILRANAGYFATFLMQQTYTQITLAVYAFVANGTEYLLATHMVYIYSLSFIFHGILFRFYLSKMSRQTQTSALRASLKQSLRLSLMLGVAAALTVVVGYVWIEKILFAKSLLTMPTAVMLGVMIMLNSTNFGWSALFMSARRPFQLSAIAAISTSIVVAGIFVTSMLSIENGLVWAMIAGLTVQAVLRSIYGLRLLAKITRGGYSNSEA
ncbi:hypothetical protein [Pacificibacter marinus]|uniref:hypothetical protein n=1 Tax=Pacificibacter marinus TaxID=658057 RepID=UPI001C077CA0|nr:hypothetical protein [Pacificibacter marinus]MBU2867474.1 hypothetical protein [Pacificibacter marinus]